MIWFLCGETAKCSLTIADDTMIFPLFMILSASIVSSIVNGSTEAASAMIIFSKLNDSFLILK